MSIESVKTAQRAIVYIDGYNLYFGVRAAFHGRHKWLDLQALCESFLKPGMELVAVKYFTAITTRSAGSKQRQEIYLKALEAHCSKLECHFGRFLAKTVSCKTCGARYPSFEEKKTDVNIACQILNDTYLDKYDICYIVSGDSDLVPPLQIVRQFHPEKRSIVAHPPKRKSVELCETANGWFAIGEKKIKRSQLPDSVITRHGNTLTRPSEWS